MRCKTCKGRGRFQVKETYSDGDEVLTWYECGDCQGTGLVQDEGGEDFDLPGGSDDDDD